jgi:predicted ribosomally synthesized peptide with SipW-like signal peptide
MSWQPGCGNHNYIKKEEKKVKKRNMVFVTSMLLVVLLIAGGTFAWFTDVTPLKINKFKAGTLDITLIDRFCPDLAQNVNPGDCYFKEVYVRNDGSKKAVVRIKKDMAFEGGLSLAPVSASISSDWFEKNGYYVYKKVLNPGQSTTGLFAMNKICFSGPLMDNTYQGKTFDIKVKAEGIQASNNAPWLNGWGVKVYYPAVRGDEVVEGLVTEATEAEMAAILEAEGAPIGEVGAVEIADVIEEEVR